MTYATRISAGSALAAVLRKQDVHRMPNLVVLGLARGGVVVAAQVARDLHAPLEVMVVRKIGLPFQPEVAMGALAPGVQILDDEMITQFNLSEEAVQDVVRRETQELQRREVLYHRGRPASDLHDRTVLLVDDGLATGMTALAAVRSALQVQPKRIIIAAPVGSREACRRLRSAEPSVRCICALEAEMFGGVGAYYEEFEQVSDEQVMAALGRIGDRE